MNRRRIITIIVVAISPFVVLVGIRLFMFLGGPIKDTLIDQLERDELALHLNAATARIAELRSIVGEQQALLERQQQELAQLQERIEVVNGEAHYATTLARGHINQGHNVLQDVLQAAEDRVQRARDILSEAQETNDRTNRRVSFALETFSPRRLALLEQRVKRLEGD